MSRHRDLTVTDWYKQDIYDRSEAKIGDVKDVLVGPNGQINAVIVGVGGFLGAGEKDVAVNFRLHQANHEGQQGLSYDGYDQGCAQERSRIQVRQHQDQLGSRKSYSHRRSELCNGGKEPRIFRGSFCALSEIDTKQQYLWNLGALESFDCASP